MAVDRFCPGGVRRMSRLVTLGLLMLRPTAVAFSSVAGRMVRRGGAGVARLPSDWSPTLRHGVAGGLASSRGAGWASSSSSSAARGGTALFSTMTDVEAAIEAKSAEIRKLKEVDGFTNKSPEVSAAVKELLALKASLEAPEEAAEAPSGGGGHPSEKSPEEAAAAAAKTLALAKENPMPKSGVPVEGEVSMPRT